MNRHKSHTSSDDFYTENYFKFFVPSEDAVTTNNGFFEICTAYDDTEPTKTTDNTLTERNMDAELERSSK